MRILDLVAYIFALGMFVLVLFSAGTRDVDAPPPLPTITILDDEGRPLAPPSRFDEQILIQAQSPQDGVGTAFAVNSDGYWLTAKHVVEGCRDVGLFVREGTYVPAKYIRIDETSDLALIKTASSPSPVRFSLDSVLRVGAKGFHVGFPQGDPGEVVSQLHSRSSLVSGGGRHGREPVLTWAELGRTRGLNGSLGGMSGGPVYDSKGAVRGVVLAESTRRGRIYSAAPNAIKAFLVAQGVEYASGGTSRPIEVDNYGGEADRARRIGQVVKVACRVKP
ncbi:MAG: serine protease [Hyphomonadaceae bacterium]